MSTLLLTATAVFGISWFAQWAIIPFTALTQKDLKQRWLWLVAMLVLPLVYIAKIQKGLIEGPSAKAWLIRGAVVAAVTVLLIELPKTSWLMSDAMFEIKGILAPLFSSNVVAIEGREVITLGTKITTSHSTQAFARSFYVAILSIIAGALQYRGPFFKAFIMGLGFFVCSFVTDLVVTGGLYALLAIPNPTPSETTLQSLIFDSHGHYVFTLWYFVMFFTAVQWAKSDIRTEQQLESTQAAEGA